MNYTYEGSIAQALDTGYNGDGVGEQGIYKGRLINKYLKFTETGYFKFDFEIVSKDSRYLQGIILGLSKPYEAEFYINGRKTPKLKGRFPKIELWENDAPNQFSVYVHLVEGTIYVHNGCAVPITPDLTYCRAQVGGCAIYIEKYDDNHYRLHCNDIDIDDDFDDLVFDFAFTQFTNAQEWLNLAKYNK